MYKIFKEVILSGDFELSSMLRKIDTMWVKNKITDEEKNELITLARENADPTLSIDIIARLDDHEMRLRKLEEGGTSPAPPSEEYPNFEPNHVYLNGDKVTFEGKKYICKLPEHVDKTTWSPKDYPPYWQEVI